MYPSWNSKSIFLFTWVCEDDEDWLDVVVWPDAIWAVVDWDVCEALLSASATLAGNTTFSVDTWNKINTNNKHK